MGDPLKRKMKTYVYLVRHGRTQQNELGILQGAGIDSDLNETGRAQCNQLKGKIPLENSLVFSSPLKRAKQTAEIITDGKCEIIFDQLLKERDFGPLEGKVLVSHQVILDRFYTANICLLQSNNMFIKKLKFCAFQVTQEKITIT